MPPPTTRNRRPPVALSITRSAPSPAAYCEAQCLTSRDRPHEPDWSSITALHGPIRTGLGPPWASWTPRLHAQVGAPSRRPRQTKARVPVVGGSHADHVLVRAVGPGSDGGSVSAVEQSIRIPALGVKLRAEVMVPDAVRGLVVLTHISSSDLNGPLSRLAVRELHGARIGTVLVHLLTVSEENDDRVTGQHRLDVKRLAHRIVAMTDWLLERADLGIGLVGTDTCAAAALVAAADRPRSVRAVVCQSGRPDLAEDFLRTVYQPTLLVVGKNEGYVVESNREAMAKLPGRARLEVVAGSIHQPDGHETLLDRARLATNWFIEYLTPVPRVRDRITDQ
jgi:putative phosphoribosyl transferase